MRPARSSSRGRFRSPNRRPLSVRSEPRVSYHPGALLRHMEEARAVASGGGTLRRTGPRTTSMVPPTPEAETARRGFRTSYALSSWPFRRCVSWSTPLPSFASLHSVNASSSSCDPDAWTYGQRRAAVCLFCKAPRHAILRPSCHPLSGPMTQSAQPVQILLDLVGQVHTSGAGVGRQHIGLEEIIRLGSQR